MKALPTALAAFISVSSVLLGLAGCAMPDPSASPLMRPYVARGQEPSWQVEIGPRTITFTTMDQRVVEKTPHPHIADNITTYRATSKSARISVEVRPHVCADTMSGMPHPDTVHVMVNEKTFQGCGGEPRALLIGAWTVIGINGAGAPTQPPVTITFDETGGTFGRAPCNAFTGAYELTGESLRLPNTAATRMACLPDTMAAETMFFDVLNKVNRFEVSAAGDLILHTAENRTLTATRTKDP